jgi:hypothetical protein
MRGGISIITHRHAKVERMGECYEFEIHRILSMSENDNTGYTFMVDLEYPEEIHDLRNDYPLAPENFTITLEMASPYNDLLASIAKNELERLC